MKTHLALCLAALPGCALFDLETDVGEVCVTYPNLAVDVPGASSSFSESFAVDDLGAIKGIADLDASVRFVRAAVRPTSGIDSLAFVSSAHVAVSSGDPASTLPKLDVYQCDGDCVVDGGLALPAPSGGDALAYVKTGSLLVDLSVAGSTPAQHFTVDVDVCMQGKAHVSYTP
jgi:hypothetical protein